MILTQPTIAVIEDDTSMRQSIIKIFDSVDINTQPYTCAEEFLNDDLAHISCIISDVRLRGISGPSLLNEISRRQHQIPVIIISGYADIEMAVGCLLQGAVNFFSKPFRNQALLDCVLYHLQKSQSQKAYQERKQAYGQRHSILTSREKNVLELIVRGRLSKNVALELNISKNTVDVHRVNIMKKMQVNTAGKLISEAVYFGYYKKELHKEFMPTS